MKLNTVDLDWENEALFAAWPRGRDNDFTMARINDAFFQAAVGGAPGRLLDVACGEARHVPGLYRRGWTIYSIEPSPAMMAKARRTVGESGAAFELVRAIGEALPFQDASFDRVLCQAALDHFADPEGGIREIARVLRSGGEAIIGLVNYGGLSCRLSRLVYALERRLRLVAPGRNLFWDTPVPHEHSFEADLPTLKRMGSPQLQLEGVYGVSLLWAFPGWGKFLGRLPYRGADTILKGLNRVARIIPSASDFLITRWRCP